MKQLVCGFLNARDIHIEDKGSTVDLELPCCLFGDSELGSDSSSDAGDCGDKSEVKVLFVGDVLGVFVVFFLF